MHHYQSALPVFWIHIFTLPLFFISLAMYYCFLTEKMQGTVYCFFIHSVFVWFSKGLWQCFIHNLSHVGHSPL
jgi:hypothetical protein